MAKKATVTYQLPVEEMHGKLATKQDVTYSGQSASQTAYNLGIGVHAASGYEQYVVLTRTRGKNRFYVRSRSSIRVTPYTQLSQALMALCSSLATQIEQAAKARPEQRPYAGILKSFEEMAPQGQTLREYLTSLFLVQVRDGAATLQAPYAPVPGQAPTYETIGDNPFLSTAAYDAAGITRSYTKTDVQKKVYQKYYGGMSSVTSVDVRDLVIVAANKKKHTIRFPEFGEGVTFEQAAPLIMGHAYGMAIAAEENTVSAIFYDGRGRQIAAGVLYTDADATTPVVKTDTVDTLTTAYFVRTLPQ